MIRNCSGPVILWQVLLLVAPGHSCTQEPATFSAGKENQLGLTFSPDGKAAYWVEWDGAWGSGQGSQQTIYVSQNRDGDWGAPAPAPIPGDFANADPYVSPDGRWLYFVSERPADENDTTLDADIWRISLDAEGRLERLSVNSGAEEYSPVITSSGTLYFASAREGGYGRGDLYSAAPAGDEFDSPELLGPSVNSATGEWNLWVSADDDEIIFEASSRSTNVSIPGDLYYSWRGPGGWADAIPINELNTSGSDLMPRLHPDGKTLYYTTAQIDGHAGVVSIDWPVLRAKLRTVR